VRGAISNDRPYRDLIKFGEERGTLTAKEFSPGLLRHPSCRVLRLAGRRTVRGCQIQQSTSSDLIVAYDDTSTGITLFQGLT